ncbi:MAG: T9SS type A sorting domain-containing protein [Bacteroidia bacterium]|nr:T9SS type A sorting domain-containing protein [Bacteroidia bacterium]
MAQFFQRAYGERNDREGVFFQSVSDGFIIAGTANDTTYNTKGYYIFKVDKSGNKIWEKQYSDAFSAYTYGLTVLDNGNIAIIGTHAGIVYSALAEVLLLDSAGNFISSQAFPPLDGWGTSGVGIVKTEDSSAAITIYTDGFISTNYYSIYRLNQDLTTRWTEFVGYDGSLINNHSMVKSNTGDFFSLSYYDFYTYSPQMIFEVSSIRKFNASGAVQLDSLFEFNVQTVSISPTNDGGCIISGNHNNAGQMDTYLIKINSNGDVMWTNEFGTAFNESTVQALQTIDGGFAVIATIPDLVLLNQNDILFVRCDANGDSLCSKKIGSTLNEIALHLEQTSDSNFAILGTTSGFEPNRIFFTVVDSTGNAPSQYDILGTGTYFCSGDSLTLSIRPTPDPSCTILWSSADTVESIVVRATGNYSATITDTLGNVSETNFYPCYFASTPQVSIGPDTMGICFAVELQNSYLGDFTIQYQWFLNDTLISCETTNHLVPSIEGTYKLKATNYCSSDSDIVYIDSIHANPLPPILFAPPVDYVCEGDSLRISALVDSTYQLQWYTADDFNSFIIDDATDSFYYATNEGVYFIRITDSFGCVNYSDPRSVAYDNIPPLVNANGPAAFCQGGEVELSTEPGTNFIWSTFDTTSTITVNIAGDYFVSYIDQFGCPKSTDTIAITILSSPFVTIGPDTMVCHDDVYILDAGPGFNNYLWNFGTVSQSIFLIATIPGIDTQTVFVFVTDTNGCTNSDTAVVIFDTCIGVDQLEAESGVTIYPTILHSGSSVYINSSTANNSISIYDISGKVIYHKDFSGWFDEVIDFSQGIYVYRIDRAGKSVGWGKLIIQ